MSGGFGEVLNNPQLQNAINTRPQLPSGVQMPTGYPPFDPNNPKGMPPPTRPADPSTVFPRPYPGQGNDMKDLMPFGTPDSFGNLPNNYGQPQVLYSNPNPPHVMQPNAFNGPMGVRGNDTPQPMNPQSPRGTLPYAPTSQEAYNRFLATSKPVQGGSLPSYEQFVQNRLNQPQVLPAQPMRPQQLGLRGLMNRR